MGDEVGKFVGPLGSSCQYIYMLTRVECLRRAGRSWHLTEGISDPESEGTSFTSVTFLTNLVRLSKTDGDLVGEATTSDRGRCSCKKGQQPKKLNG